MNANDFNAAMGAVVRRLRLEHGLTQEDVGRAMGVSYQQAQKSEKGINGFAAHYLPILAELFGVTVAYLYEQVCIASPETEPSEAECAGYLAARYVTRISDPKLRSNVVDFARKLAYSGSAA
jgi:transcriptional regulator with XRE-family HTH domain